jgi:hypothetical protein
VESLSVVVWFFCLWYSRSNLDTTILWILWRQNSGKTPYTRMGGVSVAEVYLALPFILTAAVNFAEIH